MTYDLTLNHVKAQYQQGTITPRALISELLEQAQQQADYNAWISLLTMDQLEPYFEKLDQSSPEELPLYGVPFAIKDNIDLAGVNTTAACPDFSYLPAESAFVVNTLIEAGAIPLGKTNLDQFATGLVGVRSPYGEGKNAFNPDYISGGSSAGSAIATALGQVSFALGTDTAGSGRVPAALNNLIGHKPTRGLLSNTGVVPACKSLDCVSIFTLNCEDAATVLEVAARFDPQDCYSRANPHYNRLRYFQKERLEKSRITDGSKNFTFGVPSVLDFQGDQETEALYKQSIKQLEALGGTAQTIDFEPFIEAAKLLYEGPWVAERWLATQDVKADSMLEVIRTIIGTAESKTAADGFDAQYRLKTLKRICDQALSEVDFVLTPTMPTAFTREEINEKPIERNSINGTYTNFMNLLDYSATAIPVGFLQSGVTWGVTLFSQKNNDMALLSFGHGLHQAFNLPLGATDKRPDQTNSEIKPFHQLPAPTEQVNVVVCGAHLEGQPLNWQLTERGATLVSKTMSSSNYHLYALSDGKRPGMMRTEVGDGKAIEVEVWTLPTKHFGSFVAAIPAPLGIGKVELADGSWHSGFICEASGLEGATDITELGSWRKWLEVRP